MSISSSNKLRSCYLSDLNEKFNLESSSSFLSLKSSSNCLSYSKLKSLLFSFFNKFYLLEDTELGGLGGIPDKGLT